MGIVELTISFTQNYFYTITKVYVKSFTAPYVYVRNAQMGEKVNYIKTGVGFF